MRLHQIGKEVISVLENHGHQAYFVGGFVRDWLLNRPIHDVDICTSALPEEVIKLFAHVIPTGLRHGTVTVLFEGVPVEVTTFRTEEGVMDYRHPSSVSFVSSLEEDLKRRDFTINALAMDRDDRIYDYHCGQDHLQNKLILTVGSPAERFHEDALRMLRAIRFSAQLNFNLTEDVIYSIQQEKELLAHISMERITMEWQKMMEATYPSQAFKYILATKLHHSILPFHLIKEHIERAQLHVLDQLRPIERWAYLLSCVKENRHNAEKFIKTLRLDNKRKKEILFFVNKLHEYNHVLYLSNLSAYDLYLLGSDLTFSILKMNQLTRNGSISLSVRQEIDQWYEKLPIKNKRELALKGDEIAKVLDRNKGKWLTEMIHHLEKAVVNGQVDNNKESLTHYLTSIKDLEDEHS